MYGERESEEKIVKERKGGLSAAKGWTNHITLDLIKFERC